MPTPPHSFRASSPWRVGPEVSMPMASATTLSGAVVARVALGAEMLEDPRCLKIWLVGFCEFGRWVVGPAEDRPPSSRDPGGPSFGRMGFMADTLHEALVLRHASVPARRSVIDHPELLARRLTADVLCLDHDRVEAGRQGDLQLEPVVRLDVHELRADDARAHRG